jgi:tetratricopeptide (TPR) repeat protein
MEGPSVSEYCRQDVLRIFAIREQQLRIWERNGLIACAESYSFQDLGQVRKLRELGAYRISAGSIRDSVSAMRAASGCPDPLLEAGLAFEACIGGRPIFRHSGSVVEPIAGQYLLDFTGTGKQAIATVTAIAPAVREQQAAHQFSLAVQAEEAGLIDDAAAQYEAVLLAHPGHAASAINLGTIFYNRRDYARAEQLYRMATESDGCYALAFFDLGNVLDELKRMPEAIAAYRRAIELQRNYADAHYNLALALERNGQRRSALPHWTTYLRLDGKGPWAAHARMQLRKTLSITGLSVVAETSEACKTGTRSARSVTAGMRPTQLQVV